MPVRAAADVAGAALNLTAPALVIHETAVRLCARRPPSRCLDHTLSRNVPPLAGDERAIRRLIIERKIAPFYPGSVDKANDREECPICMLVRA